jgi:biofilm protein TabA
VVFDQLGNASFYSFANPLIVRGLEFLKANDPGSLPLGRTEIDGDRVFALVQEYSTRLEKDCFWEAHRKYIDIQYLVAGKEAIGYAPLDQMQVLQTYDAGKDMMKLSGEGMVLELRGGDFAIFFPHDSHKPCMASGGVGAPVRKVVVKVAVE